MLFSSQSPATTNTQRKNSKIPNERRITSYILAETLKGLALHSKINDSAYYNSDGDDAEIHPKCNPLVDTHTSDVNKRKVTDTDTANINSPHKLLIEQFVWRICLDILAETIKVFNGLRIQSTMNNSIYCDSEEDDTESNPKVDTHTNKSNSTHFI